MFVRSQLRRKWPAGARAVGFGWLLASASACHELPRTYDTAVSHRESLFHDDFQRDALGEHWYATAENYRIERGALVVDGPRNHPLWLRQPLPDDVVIEFDTWSDDADGDIKLELAGDGESHATTVNYRATGYVLIFGGWENTLNVIARQDEHGDDRKVVDTPRVEPGRHYHFVVERRSGAIRWSIDGTEILRFADDAPLSGARHRFFAFNGWDAQTHFDNLRIDALVDGESATAPSSP